VDLIADSRPGWACAGWAASKPTWKPSSAPGSTWSPPPTSNRAAVNESSPTWSPY